MSYKPPEYTKQDVIKNVKRSGIWAVIILILIVLPAEYNIDITGFGRLTGLTKLVEVKDTESTQEDVTTLSNDDYEKARQELLSKTSFDTNKGVKKDDVVVTPVAKNTDDKVLTKIYSLGPRQDKEIKFKMNKGDKTDFTWSTTQTVYLDQHGEPTTPEGSKFLPFKSTKTGKYQRDSWTIIAEFTGTHGWYWRNLSNETIQIELTMKGQFEEK